MQLPYLTTKLHRIRKPNLTRLGYSYLKFFCPKRLYSIQRKSLRSLSLKVAFPMLSAFNERFIHGVLQSSRSAA